MTMMHLVGMQGYDIKHLLLTLRLTILSGAGETTPLHSFLLLSLGVWGVNDAEGLQIGAPDRGP